MPEPTECPNCESKTRLIDAETLISGHDCCRIAHKRENQWYWQERTPLCFEHEVAALKAEVKRLREALDYRIRRVPEIALPTEADLDWMMNAFQRHTSPGGDHSDADTIPTQPDRIPESMRRWWRQNVMDGAINARVAIGIIIRTWEAGRAKAALALAASAGPESERSGR